MKLYWSEITEQFFIKNGDIWLYVCSLCGGLHTSFSDETEIEKLGLVLIDDDF